VGVAFVLAIIFSMDVTDMGKIRHSAHWGAFTAETRDGRVVGVAPFASDPHPAPILQAMPEALYHHCRVAEPLPRP